MDDNTTKPDLRPHPAAKWVLVSDTMLVQLLENPSEPVTLQIHVNGEVLEFVATRHDCPK